MSDDAILITGGAGFIGSHLSERLLGDGRRVVCLDAFDDYYGPDAKRSNISSIADHARFELLEGDIRDEACLDRAFESAPIGAVVHLAARPGVRASLEEPIVYADVNVTGTLRVLEAARRHGRRRVVFGSSSSVYGGSLRTPFREDEAADRPLAPYAASKRAGELFAFAHAHAHRLPAVALRFFTVYGPRQRPDMAIPRFTAAIAAGEPLTVFGDGTQGRDFTFVEDIVDGIVRAIDVDLPDGWDVFNLGRGELVELNHVLAELQRLLGRQVPVEHHPKQTGDAPITLADIGHARERLGYAPRTSIDAGLQRWVAWWHAQHDE